MKRLERRRLGLLEGVVALTCLAVVFVLQGPEPYSYYVFASLAIVYGLTGIVAGAYVLYLLLAGAAAASETCYQGHERRSSYKRAIALRRRQEAREARKRRNPAPRCTCGAKVTVSKRTGHLRPALHAVSCPQAYGRDLGPKSYGQSQPERRIGGMPGVRP